MEGSEPADDSISPPDVVMEKFILSIITLLTLFAVAGCSGAPDSTLYEAEALMTEHPDSALTLLRSLDPDEIRGKSSRALYALLFTQAQFKNYIDVDNDSLIFEAVNYYEDGPDTRRSMLASYYYGRVRLNKNDYANAIFAFYNAYELADAAGDSFWTAMTAERICEIYRNTYNWKEMLKFADIEYQNFKAYGNPQYIHDGLLDLALAYHCDSQYDSAIVVYKQVLDTAFRYQNKELEEDAYRNLALSYYGKAQYDSAAILFESLCGSDYVMPSDSAYLGLMLLKSGKVSEANRILPTSKCYNNAGKWLKYNTFLALGARDSALTVLQAIVEDNDIMLKDNIKYNLSGALMDYHAYKLALENERSRFSKAMLWLAVLITVMIIIVGAYFSYRHIRRQRLQIEKNIMLADNLREMLETKDENHNRMILDLLGDRFAMLDDFCRVMYEKGNSVQAKKNVSKVVESLIGQFSQDKNKISELSAYVDAHYENVMSKFNADFPNLMENDYLLFLYSIYGFSTPAIALFLGLDNVTGVYDRRKRLKNKIKASDSGNRQIYLAILDKRR